MIVIGRAAASRAHSADAAPLRDIVSCESMESSTPTVGQPDYECCGKLTKSANGPPWPICSYQSSAELLNVAAIESPPEAGESGHAARSSLAAVGLEHALSWSRKILSLNIFAAAAKSCKWCSATCFGTISPRNIETGL